MTQERDATNGEAIIVAIIPQDLEEPVQIRRTSTSPVTALRTQQDARDAVLRVGLQRPRATLLIQEDGQNHGREVNIRASVLARAHEGQMGTQEGIAGPAILCGPPNTGASETSLPEHFLTLLNHEGAFRAQIRTHQDPDVWSGNDVLFDTWHWGYVWVLTLAERWTEVRDVRVVPALPPDLVNEWVALGNYRLSRKRPRPSFGQLFPSAIAACYSIEELIQNIFSMAGLERTNALSYRDLCLVNQSRDEENWFGIRDGVIFGVPDLLPKVADGTFTEWIRKVLAAEPAMLRAAASS